jgi:hypothetical protein
MNMVKAYKLWKITYVQVSVNTYDLSASHVLTKLSLYMFFEADHNLPSAQVIDQNQLWLAQVQDYLVLEPIPISRCPGHHLTESHSIQQHWLGEQRLGHLQHLPWA